MDNVYWKKLEEMTEGRNLEIKRDYYLSEALALAADYVSLLAAPAKPALQAVQASKAAQQDN